MKKYLITACILTSMFAFKKSTDDKKITSADINNAISKSLPLLQSSSHTFLKNAAPMILCHSCHNQGLGVVAFALAKESGFAVSDVTINEAIDSTCSFWNQSTNNQTLAENSDPVAIIMTGNYISDKILELADLVTEMKEIKHPYKKGIKAKKGIDY